MASEIEAAAERLVNGGGGEWDSTDYWNSSHRDEDAAACGEWILSRLAADRAECDERARPIDAEWLQSFGCEWAWSCSFGLVHRDGIAITDFVGGEWTCHGIKVANRGDVLDLLRALKGGA